MVVSRSKHCPSNVITKALTIKQTNFKALDIPVGRSRISFKDISDLEITIKKIDTIHLFKIAQFPLDLYLIPTLKVRWGLSFLSQRFRITSVKLLSIKYNFDISRLYVLH